MLGAIAGDVIGSVHEYSSTKTTDFPLFDPRCFFTDDSVMTIAVASAILTGRPYIEPVREIGRQFPNCGYGGHFYEWMFSDTPQPYNSWGNGSAMRASPVGFAFDTEEDVLREARLTAEFTHNHPEGIKGAQAAALAVFLARKGASKETIRRRIESDFGYNLQRTCDEIRPGYHFDVSCQGTVPEAIVAFLDSTSFEHAVRLAVSLGGDADTLACITGGIAQAYYGGVPAAIALKVKSLLTPELLEITEAFCRKYG